MGKQWKQWLTLLFWAPKSLQMVTAAIKLKDTYPWKESYDQPRQHIKKQTHSFANKGPSNQSYDFSSSHVWMWELDCKESWMPKNWCFWTVVLEKTLESPLDYKEIKPVNPKGNQSWIFIGRTDSEAETPIFCPPDVKNWLTGKNPDAGKDWRQQEKRTTEDEMIGWHHWYNAHEFERAPGVGDGQGSLVCCSQWGCKESDTNEWLNWIELCMSYSLHLLSFDYANHILYVVLTFTELSSLSSPCNFFSFSLQKKGHSIIHKRQWAQLHQWSQICRW